MGNPENVQGNATSAKLLNREDSENDNVDLEALAPLGKFDAAYFLPVIARLSNTYLEVVRNEVVYHGRNEADS